MDRLLSEQEILKASQVETIMADGTIDFNTGYLTGKQHVAAAQLAKTDKEWIEAMPIMWDKCWTKTCIYMTPDCDFLGNACMAWQERKKELENKNV